MARFLFSKGKFYFLFVLAALLTFAIFCSFVEGKRTLHFPSKRKFQIFTQPKYPFSIFLNSFCLYLIPDYTGPDITFRANGQ